MKQKQTLPDEIVLRDNLKVIKGIKSMNKIGAGHDGIVLKNGDTVLKILKYDIARRKKQNLMTFEKAIYFHDKLNLQKITKPIDIMLDKDGIYIGYVMKYLEDITKNTDKKPGDFTCEELITSSEILEEDFKHLTEKQVSVKDINRGSYIYTTGFLNICDMDKYTIHNHKPVVPNKKALNFTISKFLYYEMLKSKDTTKEELKALSTWVKKSSNNLDFLKQLIQELKPSQKSSITEYVEYKRKRII